MSGGDVLVHRDQLGYWAWAGFRLTPVLGVEATHQYADFALDRREELAADAERAWLSAQWARGAGRFEIRYRNDPGSVTALLRCACLCRVRADGEQEVTAAARHARERLAVGLPGFVRAEPMAADAEVHDWLVPFPEPAAERGQVEILRGLSMRGSVRREFGRNATVLVAGYAQHRVSWEPMLRRLAALSFPAMLTIGLEAFPASRPFSAGLDQLAAVYDKLAQPAEGLPLFSGSTPRDEHAALAALRYRAFSRQYDRLGYRVRISLAGQRPLPAELGEWLAGALSSGSDPAVGAEAVQPAFHERAAAWGNLATLGAAPLPDTHRRALPDTALGPLERELLNLADRTELGAVVQLPIAWPGRPALYSQVAADTPEEDFPWAAPQAPSPTGDPLLMSKLQDPDRGAKGNRYE